MEVNRRQILTRLGATVAAGMVTGCRPGVEIPPPIVSVPETVAPTPTPEQIVLGAQVERTVTPEEIQTYADEMAKLASRYNLPSFSWSSELLNLYLAQPQEFYERFGVTGFSIQEAIIDPRVCAFSSQLVDPSTDSYLFTNKDGMSVSVNKIEGLEWIIILGQSLRNPETTYAYTDEQRKLAFYLVLSNELMRSALLLNFTLVAKEYYEAKYKYSTDEDSPEIRLAILCTLMGMSDFTELWHFLDGFPFLMQEPDTEKIWHELYSDQTEEQLDPILSRKDSIYSIITRFTLVNRLLDGSMAAAETNPFHITADQLPEQIFDRLFNNYDALDENNILNRLIAVFSAGTFSSVENKPLTRRQLLAKFLTGISPKA